MHSAISPYKELRFRRAHTDAKSLLEEEVDRRDLQKEDEQGQYHSTRRLESSASTRALVRLPATRQAGKATSTSLTLAARAQIQRKPRTAVDLEIMVHVLVLQSNVKDHTHATSSGCGGARAVTVGCSAGVTLSSDPVPVELRHQGQRQCRLQQGRPSRLACRGRG